MYGVDGVSKYTRYERIDAVHDLTMYAKCIIFVCMISMEVYMPLLQVRNVPHDLYELLSKIAKQENRSIAQETVVLLRTALNLKEERVVRRKTVLEEIDKIRIMRPSKFPDPAKLIRKDRDR